MTDLDLDARWRSEKSAAFLSRAVADAESDATRRALFAAMADAAESQAAILAGDMAQLPRFRPAARIRLIAWLTRRLGPRATRPLLAAAKVRGLSVYAGSLHRGGPAGQNGRPPIGHAMPTVVEDIGRRHGNTNSGALRAAVFGVNDGLVSNTALVMGVAGAGADLGVIVLTGVAGLLAGAFSMAAGEYVSTRSQREMFEYQIAQEKDELERYPEEEAEELALIYNARGVDMDDARAFANQLIADPKVALDTLAREELGLDPDELGSPWRAALWSLLAFGCGATLPLAPFLIGLGDMAVPAAAGVAGIALFAVGSILSLFSGRGALWGGARMLLIGAAAGAATYAIGAALGVGIS